MRWLKTFNEADDSSFNIDNSFFPRRLSFAKYCSSSIPIDMKNEINDILLELKDIGYIGCVVVDNKYVYISRTIKKTNSHGPYSVIYIGNCDEVREVIERICDYVNQCGYDSFVESGIDTCRIFFNKK
jgi:hypothetical protein